ncbi:hypothetical protein [Galbibacter sp. PAP.153]|uniref:hypothetical protein n=1 Tax=Galbibacter sp. PAP.153 TaxID=3104623 RepID=UPI00300A1DFA
MTLKHLALYIFFIALTTKPSLGTAQKAKDTINYEFLFGTAVKGDVPAILTYLDSLSVTREKDIAFKNKFEGRFKYGMDRTDDYFSTQDTLLNPLHKLFQGYWRDGLLHPEENNDSIFKQELIAFFNKENVSHAYADGKVTEKNLEPVYKKYIEDRGYYCTGFGKAGKFYDFLVWKTMEPEVFTIDLVNHTEKVQVYFMKDFLSLGWMEYSRLGERYPGGWATNEALYCVTKGYDQTSEKFKVIYLKHEGQHFYDYKRFPGLASKDLEYRGKLVEMIYCDKELYNRVSYYLDNAKNDPRNAHPHANYRIIKNLSEEIFGEAYVTDFNRWLAVPKENFMNQA